MIVRTTPTVLPGPDAMRALERLESQLRRAADDLAVTLVEMRREYDAVLAADVAAAQEKRQSDGSCGKWMPVAGEACGRRAGHNGVCRSRTTMDAEARRKSRRAA